MEAIKRLSDRSEFFITLILVFGFPSFYSLISLIAFLQGYGGATHFNNYSLINVLELEILTGGAAGAFLYFRYWRLAHFHINMGWLQTLVGAVLFVAILLLQYFTVLILEEAFATEGQISTVIEIAQISLPVTIAVCFINSFFEELFVVGYIVQSLRKNHDAIYVVTLSAAIRTIYHLYQGPIAINIFFMGLLHAYFYWRWKSLWPLIFAHCALNFMAFGLGL
jgi:hypothetical protein